MESLLLVIPVVILVIIISALFLAWIRYGSLSCQFVTAGKRMENKSFHGMATMFYFQT